MKALMSGNEAIARGAYECGVRFASGYPGTPSTEIIESFARYEGVYAEWCPNEKVALEVGIGAAMAGAKALVTMKHVGVNVAADPLFTVSYTGTNGALVIVSADDPSMHSSQNEQDNRNYAKFAKIPMLEPSDSNEARKFTKIAFEISATFDTPVFLRTTTRLSHSKSIVHLEEPIPFTGDVTLKYLPEKYVMVPINARQRRIEVEKRLAKLKEFAESFSENRMEIHDPRIGFITSGMCYNYVKDNFPGYSYLKLGMVYPLPSKMIKDFASRVHRLYVVEELDPYFEEQIRALGIDVTGKSIFPYTCEFDPGIVLTSLGMHEKKKSLPLPELSIPPRPPNLCPGCPHRGIFYVLNSLKVFVSGDIGCYTLSYMKPLESLHSCICMGASIGIAHGMSKVLRDSGKGKIVGVIGDSTFIHSGITPLINMIYNKSDALIIILDNLTTAMTGMQDHPATGCTLLGEQTKKLDFSTLASALGVESVKIIDPYNLRSTKTVLEEELNKQGLSLVIARRACALYARREKEKRLPLRVDEHTCIGCKVCINLGCPALSWVIDEKPELRKAKKKQKGVAMIQQDLCNRCTLCAQVCQKNAIIEVNEG